MSDLTEIDDGLTMTATAGIPSTNEWKRSDLETPWGKFIRTELSILFSFYHH